jgi:hypothetical protein
MEALSHFFLIALVIFTTLYIVWIIDGVTKMPM